MSMEKLVEQERKNSERWNSPASRSQHIDSRIDRNQVEASRKEVRI